MTNRRTFIASMVGTVLSAPLASRGQQVRLRRIGFMGTGSAAGMADWIESFRAGLRELGYVEGKTINLPLGSTRSDRPLWGAERSDNDITCVTHIGARPVWHIRYVPPLRVRYWDVSKFRNGSEV